MTRQFNVVVERDSDGYFVASVPSLPGCHTAEGQPMIRPPLTPMTWPVT